MPITHNTYNEVCIYCFNIGKHFLYFLRYIFQISILVNAAFEQHKSPNGVGLDDIDLTTELHLKSKNSTKLHRTLTEKRKEYVRRIKENGERSHSYGSLHRTFKSPVFKTFSLDYDSENIENGNNEKNDAEDKPFPSIVNERIQQFTSLEKESNALESSDVTLPKLYQVCLLIGYNNATKKSYIKSQYPKDIEVPQNIEHLVFPSKHLGIQSQANQEFTLILTDENGFHIYGYCRRVLPENSEICLPLSYCLISEVRCPAFFFKVLKEIESRHGQSEAEKKFLLKNLYNLSIPTSGKFLHLKLPSSPRPKTISTCKQKTVAKRLSLEANPKWLKESAFQASLMSETRDDAKCREIEKNDEKFDFSLINRSLLNQNGNINNVDEIFISRPNDLRLESVELSVLYETLGPEILIKIFGSLLLERKTILFSHNISKLSTCVLALQSILYPFQWQYTLVTVLPYDLIEICQAPTPLLAGIIEPISFEMEDCIVVDLENRIITHECGDEHSILPNTLHESLRVSLSMVDLLNQGRMLSSVLIAEAFLRFFIELFLGYNKKCFDVSLLLILSKVF